MERVGGLAAADTADKCAGRLLSWDIGPRHAKARERNDRGSSAPRFSHHRAMSVRSERTRPARSLDHQALPAENLSESCSDEERKKERRELLLIH